jgi:glycogen debranching enzyme
MNHPTFPRLLEPAVARNPFRSARRQLHEIPAFGLARALLPAPVLPEHGAWQELYWRAWELAWHHLRQPRAESGFIASFIDPAFNDNTFMWDSAFMVQFGVYARRAFNFMGTLDNFYAKQHDDGYICREINTNEGYDFFHPFDPNGTGPNILGWAEWSVFRHTWDEERLERVFWPLLAFHRWLRAHRTWPNGLYWATGLSSGMDNQTRVPDSMLYHQHWTWVDATMQAALNCRVLGQMASALGEEDAGAELSQEHAFLLREINLRLWDEDSGFYYDVSPHGEFSPVKSIGAYWGLLDKDLVAEERIGPFTRHLYEEPAFNRPHRIPSQSADSPDYDAESGSYWRGGVWPPTNYMVLKGLRLHGRHQLAHQIARNHLENVTAVFEHTDTLWENYAPEQVAPGTPSKPDFVGWTGLTPIAILLEEIIGISVDWPLRRVVWDRRLDTKNSYGVTNYPLGNEGTMDLVGDRHAIELVTDVPFTLVVREGEEVLQTAVATGVTTITH